MASPLEAFLSGKERGQGIQQRQLNLQQSRQAAPLVQRQRELGVSQQQQQFDVGQTKMGIQRGKLLLNSINAIQSATPDPAQRMQLAQQAAPELSRVGIDIDFSGLSPADFTDQGLEERKAVLAGAIPRAEENITAFERQLGAQAEAITGATNPATGEVFTEEEARRQVALRQTGIVPRAGISAQERIAQDPGLVQQVAGSQAQIAGERAAATEEAKLSVQKEIKPEIEKAILAARQEAENRGEALSDLAKARAALPGVRQVVSQLRELTPVATATFTGRAFDTVARELGFGATEGATARAKYIAIIDNELLPLLKQTFGAAFTEAEGRALKATLGDPDASSEEKNAQLDAFVDSKMRQIETSEREIGVRDIDQGPPSVTTQAEFDALPSGAVFIEDGVEYRKP